MCIRDGRDGGTVLAHGPDCGAQLNSSARRSLAAGGSALLCLIFLTFLLLFQDINCTMNTAGGGEPTKRGGGIP
jgi:hypothetical protein